jgi:hypothetical protein
VRLFDRLREEEGASYSPSATHSASDAFPNWGILYAAAESARPGAGLLPRRARGDRDLERQAGLAGSRFARAQNR